MNGSLPASARWDMMTGMPARGAPLPALTGLRFLAALHVVTYHALRPALVDAAPGPAAFLQSGPTAVTLFFVLSGFVLVHAYGSAPAPRPFLAARMARLVPLYWAALALALPLGLAARARGIVDDPLGAGSLALVATGLQAWVPDAALRWNPPAWSLSCELFFYLLFPALVRQVARLGPRGAIVLGAGAWLIGAALPLVYLALAPDGLAAPLITDEAPWLNAVKLSPLARLPDFVVGVVAGQLFATGRRVGAALGLGALLLTLLVAGSGAVPSLVLHNGLLAPLFALFIAWLASSAGPLSRALSGRALGLLGESSYALYLLHVPLMMWAMALTRTRALPPSVALVAVGLAIPLSVVAHLALERPARRWLRRRLGADSP